MNDLVKRSYLQIVGGLFFQSLTHKQSGRYFPWLFMLSVLVIGRPAVTAQHNLVLYNLQQVPQSNLLNPGYIPDVQVHVGLPVLSGVRIGAGNTGFSYNQYDRTQKSNTLDFDFAGLGDHLRTGNNRLVANTDVRFLSLGLRRGNGYFSFDVGDASFASGNYTRDMLGMFNDIQNNRLGPGSSDTLYDQSQHNLSAAYYRSYSVGYAHQLCSDLSLGGRFRYLQGVAGIWTENNGLMFQYPGDGDYFQTLGQMTMYGAGLNISEEESVLSALFPGGNSGFAFDFGAVYRVNERIEVSLSAVNLGRIKWKSNVNYQMVGSQLYFKAVDIEEHLEQWGELADDLINGEGFSDGLYFMTSLPKRFYLGGNYYIRPNTSVGLVINPVRYEGVTDMAFAVTGNTQLGKVLGLSAALGYNDYSSFNLGLGATADLGAVQVYAATDNLFSAFNWKNAWNVQGQFGMNLNFGGGKRDDKTKMNAIAMESSASDTTGIWPAAEQTVPSAIVPFPSSPDPSRSGSSLKPTRTTTTDVVNSPGVYTLSGLARDLETGEQLQGVQVEVYKVMETGEKKLDLIRSFLNGQLSVSLYPDYTYQVVVNKQGYEPTEVLIQKSSLQSGTFNSKRDILLRKPMPVAASKAFTPPPPPSVVLEEDPLPVIKEEHLNSSVVLKKTLPEPSRTDLNKETIQEEKERPVAVTPLETYRLLGSTSLRQGPSHTTAVILRLKAGDEVAVLDKFNQWWWKVRFREQTGYVKAQSLERL